MKQFKLDKYKKLLFSFFLKKINSKKNKVKKNKKKNLKDFNYTMF